MYKIVITDHFKSQLKKLVKKDAPLKENLKNELLSFEKQKAISIGAGVYKIRVAGHGKGKSGGYRVNLAYKELTLHLNTTKEELLSGNHE